MGDRFYHRLEIGGDPGEHRDELMKLIMHPTLCPEYTKPWISEHLIVSYCDAPVVWLDGVTCKLREMNLPFNHYDRRNEDGNEYLECWRPGYIEALSFPIIDDQPAVLLPELIHCLDTHGMNLFQVIERFTPPELPPFVSDASEIPASTPEPENAPAETQQTPYAPLVCDFCNLVVPNAEYASAAGWEPSYWDGDREIQHPVCSNCVGSHLKLAADGEMQKVPDEATYAELRMLRSIVDQIAPRHQLKLMEDMTEPELKEHVGNQVRFLKSCQTPDTIGSMLVIFQRNGISQYGATIDPETAPKALRELADRIERRDTVAR